MSDRSGSETVVEQEISMGGGGRDINRPFMTSDTPIQYSTVSTRLVLRRLARLESYRHGAEVFTTRSRPQILYAAVPDLLVRHRLRMLRSVNPRDRRTAVLIAYRPVSDSLVRRRLRNIRSANPRDRRTARSISYRPVSDDLIRRRLRSLRYN